VPFNEPKVRRLITALVANMDKWATDAAEIADAAHPTTGNKARALHLQRSLITAKNAVEHILKDAEKG
jgi:hypothetical protein